ncbi:50S ribosomal protein L13 [Candidatus Woesearchaeota archaeon]|nr:50S ribosomal protein L13 [Candidatus Woesearchaeota archaeon]
MVIINAENLILGRIATVAAKKALLGEEVIVINSEKAMISGDRDIILEKYLKKWKKGIPLQGPYVSRMPDRLMRRTIRGMLPWKMQKGRDAFKRVMCYIGIPEKYKEEAAFPIEHASTEKLVNIKCFTLGEICKLIGAKI